MHLISSPHSCFPPSHRRAIRRLCFLAIALTLSFAATATGDETNRYRKLDASERVRAIDQAMQSATPELSRRADRSARRSFRSEVLLVERHRYAKGEDASRRLADVYLYDYEEDHLCRAIVDLDRNEVESLTVEEGVQLPLTETERARAFELALSNPQLEAQLRRDYQAVTGRALTNPSALEVSGFVYRAPPEDESTGPGTQRSQREARICGKRRCAQLMLRTADGFLLELPVVDLSRQKLLDATRFGVNEKQRRRRGAQPKGHEGERGHEHGGHHAH